MDTSPSHSYTTEEEPERVRFLAEHPDWDCTRQMHVIGDLTPGPQGFRATGCCWVCGKAVA